MVQKELKEEQQEALELHVLDLPQLHSKPSSDELLQVLDWLKIEPSTWNIDGGSAKNSPETPNDQTKPRINPRGIAHYLTRIVASPLAWIYDDSAREDIYNLASARLAERSGRTGNSSMTRTFSIPTSKDDEHVDIRLNEPALTEDNLGFKTWASSHLLAQSLPRLPDDFVPEGTCLELGAGTGLVGIAAATLLSRNVILTDLSEIVANLAQNVALNSTLINRRGGEATVKVLDWTMPRASELHEQRFSLIFAADPLYSPSHPTLLVDVITAYLSSTSSARVLVEIPLRAHYQPEREDFQSRMSNAGLELCMTETHDGYDDWTDKDGRQSRVQCEMTGWKWSEAALARLGG